MSSIMLKGKTIRIIGIIEKNLFNRWTNQAQEKFEQNDAKLNLWKQNKSLAQNNIEQLNKELSQRKLDQQEILLERLRDKDRADIYTEMLEKCELVSW